MLPHVWAFLVATLMIGVALSEKSMKLIFETGTHEASAHEATVGASE